MRSAIAVSVSVFTLLLVIHTVLSGSSLADSEAEFQQTLETTRGSRGDLDEWLTLSAMPTRRSFSSVGVWSEFFCVYGGWEGGDPALSETECYDPAIDTWWTGAPMPVARRKAATVVLGNRSLVIGGDEGFLSGTPNHTASYDPLTDSWELLPPLPANRTALAATAMAGDAYAVGGYDPLGFDPLRLDPGSDMFRFNASTGLWSLAPPMPTPRYGLGSATINGKVYALGGITSPLNDPSPDFSTVVEEFDPATGAWSAKSAMPTKRAYFATAVVEGKLLVIGGQGNDWVSLSSIEVYDPSTDTWSPGERIPTPRIGPVAAIINGTLYVVGGEGHMYDANDALYPGSNAWSRETPMPTLRYGLGVAVSDGKMYATGGWRFASWKSGHVNATEEYDPVGETWTAKSPIPTPRADFGVAELDGEIYTIGGCWNNSASPSDVAEVYNVTTDSWHEIDHLPISTVYAEAATLGGKIYVIVWNQTFSFDPKDGNWTELAPIPHPRHGFSLVPLDGLLYAVGGSDTTAPGFLLVPEVDIYSPNNNSWWTTSSLPTPREGVGGVALNGKVYIMGGISSPGLGASDLVEVYDPTSRTWAVGPPLLAPRDRFGTAIMDGTVYVVGGSRGRLNGDYFALNEAIEASSEIPPNEEPPTEPGTPPAFNLTLVPDRERVPLGGIAELIVYFNNTGGSPAHHVEIQRNFSLPVEIGEETSSIENGTRHDNGTWNFPFVEPGCHHLSLRIGLTSETRKTSVLVVSFLLEFRDSSAGGKESVSATVHIEFFLEEKPESTVVLVTVVGAGASVIGIAVLINESLRFHLMGLFAILWTKLGSEKALDNEKRGMIRGYLAANPGANFASIRDDLRMATGTLVHHLRVLQKEGIIKSWNDGRFKRFALSAHPMADIEPKLTDFELILLQTIQNNPRSTQTELAKMVGVSQSTISYRIAKLTERGIINSARYGLRKRYSINPDIIPAKEG